MPAALIVAACTWGPAWPRGRATVALAALGDASYSLYLTHPFVIRLLRVAWVRLAPDGTPIGLFLFTSLIASLAVAWLVFRAVERPMTAALSRRSGAVPPPATRLV